MGAGGKSLALADPVCRGAATAPRGRSVPSGDRRTLFSLLSERRAMRIYAAYDDGLRIVDPATGAVETRLSGQRVECLSVACGEAAPDP